MWWSLSEVLVERQLLFYTVFNVLTYPNIAPSTDNNGGSNRPFRIFEVDVLYTVAVDEGGVNLKFEVMSRFISKLGNI